MAGITSKEVGGLGMEILNQKVCVYMYMHVDVYTYIFFFCKKIEKCGWQ